MRLESRTIRSSDARELYLAAVPDSAAPSPAAAALFQAVRAEADKAGARIARLRVFVPEGCDGAYDRAFQAAFAGAQSQVPCTWLQAGPGAPGGVQAHAIASPAQWSPLKDDAGRTAGWLLKNGRMRWALTGGLCKPRTKDDEATTCAAFEAAERVLAQADMRLSDVARTWFFLDDILSWYDRFNAGRNRIFTDRRMLGPAAAVHPDGPAVPASTGIGASPSEALRLAMELFAAAGEDGCIVRRPAAGRQKSAYKYGSAFARAAEAASPAGRTFFVSGTAAIDAAGLSCHLGDAPAQIDMTLRCVLAVLSDLKCGPGDVVEAIAYCKTPAVAEVFHGRFRQTLPWPWVQATCDVCRDDLLFEVEVTAAKGR